MKEFDPNEPVILTLETPGARTQQEMTQAEANKAITYLSNGLNTTFFRPVFNVMKVTIEPVSK